MQNVLTIPRPCGNDSADGDLPLVLAAQVEASSFAGLYRRYRDRMYRYVRSRTSTDEDAEDLTQQIFTRALDALHQYNPRRGQFAAWLFGIARNTLASYHRGRHPAVPYDFLPESLHPVAAEDPPTEALRREELIRLGDALRRLDPHKRELLILRYGAQLSIADISRIVGKREGAVRKQLERTVRVLADEFEGEYA